MVVWNYPGTSPEGMERRVVIISERAYSTTVNGIERIESQSIPHDIVKIYFQPGTSARRSRKFRAYQIRYSVLRHRGVEPPVIIQFNASNVPVAGSAVSSKKSPASEQTLFDYGLNFIRVGLLLIPGLSTPAPFFRRQTVKSWSNRSCCPGFKGGVPSDVVNALQNSNVILPAGTARMGDIDYSVLTNASPPGTGSPFQRPSQSKW